MIHLQLWKPKSLSDLHERYPWKTFERFYPLAKRYGFTDRDEVDKFLKKDIVHDHFLEARAVKKPRKPFLPIFSKIPNAFQFDTFFTKSSQWLVFININTRKAYAYPMPDKSSKSVIAALEKFHEDVPEVKILESDQDSAYLSKEFLAKINEYDIG
jgi:hypothetical protein